MIQVALKSSIDSLGNDNCDNYSKDQERYHAYENAAPCARSLVIEDHIFDLC